MDPWCNCGKQEYQVFHSIIISNLQHQHDYCNCWSIAKRGNSEVALNILHFTHHLAVNMWSWNLFQIPILSKFIPNLAKT